MTGEVPYGVLQSERKAASPKVKPVSVCHVLYITSISTNASCVRAESTFDYHFNGKCERSIIMARTRNFLYLFRSGIFD